MQSALITTFPDLYPPIQPGSILCMRAVAKLESSCAANFFASSMLTGARKPTSDGKNKADTILRI